MSIAGGNVHIAAAVNRRTITSHPHTWDSLLGRTNVERSQLFQIACIVGHHPCGRGWSPCATRSAKGDVNHTFREQECGALHAVPVLERDLVAIAVVGTFNHHRSAKFFPSRSD